jgi:SagB-type dehydrogenase family enzyme
LNVLEEEHSQPIRLAELFHENTKILPHVKRNRKAAEINFDPFILRLTSIPPKQYENVTHIELPHVNRNTKISGMTLEETICQRLSTRQFSSSPLSLHSLSKVLYFSSAILEVITDGKYKSYRRAVPTSGGLTSIEVYPLVLNVKGIRQGVFHYDSLNHRLDFLREGYFKDYVRNKLLFQPEFSDAAALLILTSWFSKLKFKYGERGYRYAFLDAGHVGGHMYLIAACLNLACCGICGFYDDEVNSLIGVDGLDESAIYLIALGQKSSETSMKVCNDSD